MTAALILVPHRNAALACGMSPATMRHRDSRSVFFAWPGRDSHTDERIRGLRFSYVIEDAHVFLTAEERDLIKAHCAPDVAWIGKLVVV